MQRNSSSKLRLTNLEPSDAKATSDRPLGMLDPLTVAVVLVRNSCTPFI